MEKLEPLSPSTGVTIEDIDSRISQVAAELETIITNSVDIVKNEFGVVNDINQLKNDTQKLREDLNKVAVWQKTAGQSVEIYPISYSQLEIWAKTVTTETLPSSGTKSIDNQSTITGTNNLAITVCGENLFNENNFKSYALSETGSHFEFDLKGLLSINLTPNITFLPNTQYTFMYTAKQTTGNPRIRFVYTDGSSSELIPAIPTTFTSIKGTSTSGKTLKYITGTYSSSGGNWYIQKNSCCLVKGTVLNSFVPYSGTIYNIPLPSMAWGLSGVQDEIDLINKKLIHNTGFIQSYNGENVGSNFLSASGGLDIGAKVVYQLNTPIIETIANVPEIFSLLITDKYSMKMNTINSKVYNMSVGYQMNLNVLKNAIVSLGGGVLNV